MKYEEGGAWEEEEEGNYLDQLAARNDYLGGWQRSDLANSLLYSLTVNINTSRRLCSLLYAFY